MKNDEEIIDKVAEILKNKIDDFNRNSSQFVCFGRYKVAPDSNALHITLKLYDKDLHKVAVFSTALSLAELRASKVSLYNIIKTEIFDKFFAVWED